METQKTTIGFSKIPLTLYGLISNAHGECCCYYCGLTEWESRVLYYAYPERTRGGRRGKRLERDRMVPTLGYNQTANIVKACYWCNNAKMNFFSAERFKRIAPGMGNELRDMVHQILQVLPTLAHLKELNIEEKILYARELVDPMMNGHGTKN
jgi:hypothetical protein